MNRNDYQERLIECVQNTISEFETEMKICKDRANAYKASITMLSRVLNSLRNELKQLKQA